MLSVMGSTCRVARLWGPTYFSGRRPYVGGMDVTTPGEVVLSTRSAVSAALAVALSAAIVVPGVVVPNYARAGAVLLLAAVVGAALRVAVAAAAAATVRRSPPAPPAGDWPAVSVVVTAYNEADVLDDTVTACTALDYPGDALEVVVCYEAASEDATEAVARAAADQNPCVRAVERPGPPAGKAAAVNHAFAHATGDVVASLDADQRPEPGALRRAVRWFEDDAVWCVKGRCFGRNPDASVLALCATVERAVAERAEFYARDLLGGFALFTGGQAFFRADVLETVGPFDESILLEDLDMAHRIQRAGGEVRVDPEVVTDETNPGTFVAWWSQRKRWARGGMQVARRHLGRDLLSGPPSLGARMDFAATLGGLLALPLAVAGAPLVPLAWWTDVGPTVPTWVFAVLAVSVAVSLLTPYLVFAIDARDGRHHARREYVAPLLLLGYFSVQAGTVLAAFLEEFVLQRPAVYVTSTDPAS